jgi:membrane protease YdiL (CAAX protease family)
LAEAVYFVKLIFVQNEELKNLDYNQPLIRDLERNAPGETIPTPNNPPWNSLAAFGVWFASFLFIAVVPLFLVIPYALKSNVVLIDKTALADFVQNDPTAIFLGIAGVLPAHLLTLLLAWLVVTRFKKYSFRETLGWKSGGFAWWYYPLIFAGIIAVSAVVTFTIPEQDNELARILRSSQAAVFAVAILATFTAPLAEEVVYRGILYSAFQRTFGVAPAVIIVTMIFAGVHFLQYWGSPGTIFLICFLSLVLTLVRVYSKNLLPCIILHTIINGVQAILLVAQTFLPSEPKAAAVIHLLK